MVATTKGVGEPSQVTAWGWPCLPAGTEADAGAPVATTVGQLRRSWPDCPQTPHLRCLRAGLSIGVAGLSGDDIKEE